MSLLQLIMCVCDVFVRFEKCSVFGSANILMRIRVHVCLGFNLIRICIQEVKIPQTFFKNLTIYDTYYGESWGMFIYFFILTFFQLFLLPQESDLPSPVGIHYGFAWRCFPILGLKLKFFGVDGGFPHSPGSTGSGHFLCTIVSRLGFCYYNSVFNPDYHLDRILILHADQDTGGVP